MKIAVQHVWPAVGEEGVKFFKRFNSLVRQNMDLVKSEGTEITFQIPRRGLTGIEAFLYAYMNHVNDVETFHGILKAEKEGYDAVIEWCFFDPMLRDARQAVDIPVVGPGEAAMLMATMMGPRFGIVTISPMTKYVIEENIKKYGLADRAISKDPVRPIPTSLEDQVTAVTDSSCLMEDFKKVGRELIADGAEVLIPACMMMCPCLRIAPGAKKSYPNGLTEVDGVPVMDVVAVTIKMTEALVSLKKAGSPWISRKLYYASAKGNPKALEEAKEILEYTGPGFWTD